MGLDVYVGSLSRYYAGEWETIIQQSSHELGIEIRVVHADESQKSTANRDEIHRAILNWRSKVSRDLQNKIRIPLDWDESVEAPYFTDKPTWDSYAGLLFWAAYAEHPDIKIPSYLPDEWSKDPAYQASLDEGFQSVYNQLLSGAELWLPCDFDFTFSAADVNGNSIVIGSTKALLSQLDRLNGLTWNADNSTLEDWFQVAAEREATIETHARFAFALFHELTKNSVENNLPMKLDY